MQRTAGNRVVQRLLGTSTAGKQLGPDGPMLQRGPDDPKQGGSKKKTDDEKALAWTRARTRGPLLLDGKAASYQIFFDHILPPVPKGATQVWQVVESHQQTLTAKCNVEKEHDFTVDIVAIGDRKKINDTWGWIPAGDPCFAKETNTATIGFDDGKSDYTDQTNVRVAASDAKDLLRNMKGPKGTYTGTYTFVGTGGCSKCAKEQEKLQKSSKTPAGEALNIAGVGEFPKPG